MIKMGALLAAILIGSQFAIIRSLDPKLIDVYRTTPSCILLKSVKSPLFVWQQSAQARAERPLRRTAIGRVSRPWMQ